MSYQVLARKWRPQRFDDVIGQRGVTQTLRNAITAKRIAQSFVFAGPRGVGKTTTARILARALNCEQGPTPDPCGVCDACVEIAQGRDMDVLEIDAATNTQVDKVRDVIITGLGIAPVRDRYKVFIIDEVHRLSPQAFDALLKSIEEPPPHVVFMMATTEIDKVPQTIQSRSQVFELKTIGLRQIADQLRRIADAEGIQADDAALMLIARAGDGSMRDAQSAFDQVIAFAGTTLTADEVSSVLGLVSRDLLIAMASAVADENAAAAFELARRAVESGYDLRSVIRELARLASDLMVLTIDPARASDPEIASETERQPLSDLAKRFSGEDLMRAFDVLTKAEYDIKGSQQPRFHLEMALLRWMHLRKLVPLSDVIQQLGGGRAPAPAAAAARTAAAQMPTRQAAGPPAGRTSAPPAPAVPGAARVAAVRAVEARQAAARAVASAAPQPQAEGAASRAASGAAASPVEPAQFKDAFLGQINKTKRFFHGTVVAQAQRIEVDGDRVVFLFAPQHRALKTQLEQAKAWLEPLASEVAGRRMTVTADEGVAAAQPRSDAAPAADTPPPVDRQEALKQQALADSSVQTLLDVFGGEIKDVEEM